MPVVSSPLPLFEKPLLYTELGMVSVRVERLIIGITITSPFLTQKTTSTLSLNG